MVRREPWSSGLGNRVATSNPKHELRNSKQYPTTEIQSTEKGKDSRSQRDVFVLGFGTLEFQICFEFLYSDFEFT